MAPDDLSIACRLSGLTADELWHRYLEVGGNRSRSELEARLAGAVWPPLEDRYLAVVADEALRDAGLQVLPPPAVPGNDPVVDAPVLDVLCAGGDREPDPAARAVLRTHAQARRLTTLFQRCARTRAEARGVRAQVETTLRTGCAQGGPDLWGGR